MFSRGRAEKADEAIEYWKERAEAAEMTLRNLTPQPPTAQFEIGQVVKRNANDSAFSVADRMFHALSGYWKYTNCRTPRDCDWVCELELRKLTYKEFSGKEAIRHYYPR